MYQKCSFLFQLANLLNFHTHLSQIVFPEGVPLRKFCVLIVVATLRNDYCVETKLIKGATVSIYQFMSHLVHKSELITS